MILIVDDVPGVTLAFGRVLNHVGVPYESADSLATGRAAVERDGWTGFILDIFLPDGTGVDLLEFIRQQPQYHRTPAAIITADILLEDSLVARIEAGCASLNCGVFNRAAIETICLGLLLARSETR